MEDTEREIEIALTNLDLIKEENSNLIQNLVFYVFNKQKYRFSHRPKTNVLSLFPVQRMRTKVVKFKEHSDHIHKLLPTS